VEKINSIDNLRKKEKRRKKDEAGPSRSGNLENWSLCKDLISGGFLFGLLQHFCCEKWNVPRATNCATAPTVEILANFWFHIPGQFLSK